MEGATTMSGTCSPNTRLAAARRRMRLTQEELAARVSRRLRLDPPLDGNYVSKLERGVHTWPNARYRQALRAELDSDTDEALGFYCARSVPQEDDDDVKRRTLFSLTPGATGRLLLDDSIAEHLARAKAATSTPVWVGQTDVEHIRHGTRVFAEWENLAGGGLSSHAVCGHLRGQPACSTRAAAMKTPAGNYAARWATWLK